MNWEDLAATSAYQTAVAARKALAGGDVSGATLGLEKLIDALSRSDKRALKSHLIRLMAHVIKWQCQPDRRSRSWRASIRNARREIASSQEETPSLSRAVIESMWQDCFEAAREEAEGEMDREAPIDQLTWNAVFKKAYELK